MDLGDGRTAALVDGKLVVTTPAGYEDTSRQFIVQQRDVALRHVEDWLAKIKATTQPDPVKETATVTTPTAPPAPPPPEAPVKTHYSVAELIAALNSGTPPTSMIHVRGRITRIAPKAGEGVYDIFLDNVVVFEATVSERVRHRTTDGSPRIVGPYTLGASHEINGQVASTDSRSVRIQAVQPVQTMQPSVRNPRDERYPPTQSFP